MEITFLGTGAGIPSKQRSLPAIFCKYRDETWLWDCGEGTQRQMMIAGISHTKIDRIFISHFHADHFVGLIGLIQTMNLEGRTAPLDVYGPEAERFIDDIIDLGYFSLGFPVVAKNVSFEGKEGVIFEGKNYQMIAVPQKHTVPAVGYIFIEKSRVKIDMKKAKSLGIGPGPHLEELKLKGKMKFNGKSIKLDQIATTSPGLKVAYSGDSLVNPKFFKLAESCDAMLHDCTFLDKTTHGHSNIGDVAKECKKYKTKKLIATHISRRYQSSSELLQEAKKYLDNVVIAEDFMKISL